MGVSGVGKRAVGALGWPFVAADNLHDRHPLPRAGHYLQAGLLESQFGALERPADALAVNVDRPLRGVAACILGGLHLTAAVEIQEAQETL